MMELGLSEMLAAFVGAAASGVFGIFDRRSNRKRNKASLESEIAAHARFLTALIRDQKYHVEANQVALNASSADWNGDLLHIFPKREYLNGLERAIQRVGELDPWAADLVVEFHHRCTLFLDSTNPDERFERFSSIDEKRSHAIETARNIDVLLVLGDRLSQWRK